MIEPVLAPGSQLVDARADDLVRKMGAWLVANPALTIEAEEVYDEVPPHSPRQQLTSVRRVSLQRPDRLAGDATGDAIDRAFFYDGRTLSLYDRAQNVWTSGAVPPTIDGALDFVLEETGTIVPLADLLYADPYGRLMGSVQRGTYLGIHDVDGVPCHHLAFEQATVDWQLWIEAGAQPAPRKLVISYKTEDEVPQYAATIRRIQAVPTLPDALFRFTPPAGATRVEVIAVDEAPPSGDSQAQEKRQ
jgi:hypothetical protein